MAAGMFSRERGQSRGGVAPRLWKKLLEILYMK